MDRWVPVSRGCVSSLKARWGLSRVVSQDLSKFYKARLPLACLPLCVCSSVKSVAPWDPHQKPCRRGCLAPILCSFLNCGPICILIVIDFSLCRVFSRVQREIQSRGRFWTSVASPRTICGLGKVTELSCALVYLIIKQGWKYLFLVGLQWD